MVETEEWFRGFNCWPLPLLTLSMCLIETYYYVTFSMEPVYVDALLDTGLAWTPKTRNETHRFVTLLSTDEKLAKMVYILISSWWFVTFLYKHNATSYGWAFDRNGAQGS